MVVLGLGLYFELGFRCRVRFSLGFSVRVQVGVFVRVSFLVRLNFRVRVRVHVWVRVMFLIGLVLVGFKLWFGFRLSLVIVLGLGFH